jgi:RNA polymerase-binding protein DksA
MARAGASESLGQPAPKARASGRSGAKAKAVPAPAKAAKKASEKSAAPAKKAAAPAKKAAAPAKKSAAPAKKAPTPAKKAPAPAKKASVPAKKALAPAKKALAPAKRAPAPAKKPQVRVGKAAKPTPPPRATAVTSAAPERVAEGFSAKTLDKLRRLLEEERETYLRQARDLAAEAEALASEREPGDTQFDEESGEGDTLNIERERDLALSASARQAVEEIDRALFRMAAGTYGVCERCGKKISVARLEALPYAALCIDCKSREERRR